MVGKSVQIINNLRALAVPKTISVEAEETLEVE